MRSIAVFTSTRADYGLLRPVLFGLRDDPEIDLRLIVSGTHLSPEFGSTEQVIEADGFTIDERVDIQVSGESDLEVAKSLALCTMGCAESLARLRPDLLVVLGDRYETLGAAQAALVLRIPIAHIHGGEVTEGAFDEAIRHSITKMAHIHLVANEVFARRVAQLGEDPQHIHTVGAPGLDTLKDLEFLSREALEKELDLEWSQPAFLVTYHPTTLYPGTAAASIAEVLAALDEFPEATVVFTMANADPEGQTVNRAIADYAQRRRGPTGVYPSLGHRRYLSAMRLCDVVIGNSSSGLIEAPMLGAPTVNIGQRQAGRLRAESVIDCEESASEVAAAIRTALTSEFRATARGATSPYGDGAAAPRIVRILRETDLDGLLNKRFQDLPGSEG